MRQALMVVALICPAAWFVPATQATTSLPNRAEDTRTVTVVRDYQIPATKGRKTVAAIPALMSFWGRTNQQVITQSDFTYSLKPDKIDITADDRGMPRRNYELTWNAPDADTIKVTQKLTVRLACCNSLATAAKLPYPKAVSERFAKLLAKDDEINPDNPEIDKICKEILAKATYAEDAVELVCDWINDNIPFKTHVIGSSDKIMTTRIGNCAAMANVACAMLRHLGLPAETVGCVFVNADFTHTFIEVYFPDAGWVFYDLSNWDRGYKRLDCVMEAGWSFRVGDGKQDNWHEGVFCSVKDAAVYKEPGARRALRPTPTNTHIIGVRVVHQKTPDSVRVRHEPLSELLLDLKIPPGKRDYSKDVSPLAPTPVAKQTVAASNSAAASAKSAVPAASGQK